MHSRQLTSNHRRFVQHDAQMSILRMSSFARFDVAIIVIYLALQSRPSVLVPREPEGGRERDTSKLASLSSSSGLPPFRTVTVETCGDCLGPHQLHGNAAIKTW